MRNKHYGETCLVIGNGPSLDSVPNEFLSRFPTFGTNRGYPKFEPTYYVYVDPDADKLSLYLDEVNALKSTKFAASELSHLITDSISLNVVHEFGFSVDPLQRVYGYFSSATVMFQLAYWMGFARVGLVGFDHQYKTPAGARDWYPAEKDINHFTKQYYKAGTYWKAPDLKKLTEWFRLAKGVFTGGNREIINLTEGGALDVFKRGSYATFS